MISLSSIRLLGIGLAICIACAGRGESPGPALQVLGESTRWRFGDPVQAASPWFDGTKVTLVAARGETIGIQVFHRAPGIASVRLDDPGVTVGAFAVEHHTVSRPSSRMFGSSSGSGSYPDAITPAFAPATNPAYFEIVVGRDATPGERTGELVVAGRRFPLSLTISPVTLPPMRLDVWAYLDQREIAWSQGQGEQPVKATPRSASAAERSCIDMFRAHGVLLSPDMTVDVWPARRELLFGVKDIPAWIPDDPKQAGDAVRAWIAATAGTGQVPFAIPIDEPSTPAARKNVRELADVVRAAGGGPNTFRFAVTDAPRPEYGDAIDLYISWKAAHLTGDRHDRWTYNGKPPRAGSMVLDTQTPGTRTWGWIAHRWKIPVWYVWDALYWHDRHNRKGAPLPGRSLDPTADSVSWTDGEDRGNFDGVLALPAPGGCKRTLRLAALRRGFQDRALLELAARCNPDATAKLAAEVVPRALGDAGDDGAAAWSLDEGTWELARRKLLDLANCAK